MIKQKLKGYRFLAPYIISFCLPLVIMFLVFLSQNISWGSERTILASDGFHQYVIFAQTLRNILHGSDSIFYTFTSGLGLNFYALISYYLGSLLSPLVYFFDLQSMPDGIYLLTLLKYALIGLTSYFSLRRLQPKLSSILVLSLSTSYALMSFATSQTEINMWLDVFMIFPLIILGLERLLTSRRFLLYYLSLSLLLILNYYFGYMAALFLALYFLVKLAWQQTWKERFRKTLDFTLVSISSGLTAAIMLLPSYLDLSTHGESFSSWTSWLTEDSFFLDIFAKNMVGSYDTTKFGAIPMIYVGLLPLIFALIFFTISSIKWYTRLAYALLVAILIASFYLQPLDLLWQGMHAPNMFLHRYAWLFSFLLILLAAESLSHLVEFSWKHYAFGISIPLIGFLLTLAFPSHYDYLGIDKVLITLAFLAAYAIIFISFSKKQLTYLLMLSFTLIFTVFEASINSYYEISSLNQEWVFPTREGYNSHLTAFEKLVEIADAQNQTFFRTERLEPQTGNDSMKYNYNGISQFSSIRNTNSSSVLDRLGYKSTGTNLNLRYQNNTILMDSIFGVKYNLTSSDPHKFGFTKLASQDDYSLYENQYASQLAILTNGVYKDVNFTVNTLDNQESFVNQLTGLNEDYFTRLESQALNSTPSINNRVNLTNSLTGGLKAEYQVTIPANSQVYVSIPNLSFGNSSQENVQITVNDVTSNFTTDNAYTFFNVGQFSSDETVTITLSFAGNNQVSFDQPHFYALNLDSYEKAMTQINDQEVSVTTSGNQVTATYQTNQDASLFFTLPYDKGWTATQNGKTLNVRKAQNGFMAIDVEAGKGSVTLTFIPDGLKEGALLSLSGLILFSIYTFFIKRKQK
ncbi:YfhO family protein [Streptococcus loxodontisalivarius]|uniref:Membrane protein YfhO n=1 Tax=Streptococcus loxodontisalivarius TaxID=1349415 RepID=A0ABS2PPT1_9STRE|nr:YfhO family protein [Streptococcus loxodontisalivarius]MBM7641886.1 putative membrane protein YfhO [Streptococcus loxodontisalivarius]